ncbi:MAG: bifunctional DNA primase/polymerase, partial [Bacteroidetes bacterium]|nr:bifunctional DNA primase/polymerase [Bacteroidota bacterium]
MTEDEKTVQTEEASTEEQTSTEETTTQPSIEEQITKAMGEQVENMSRKIQSATDKAIGRIQREADSTAKIAEDALATMDATFADDAEETKPKPRRQDQFRSQLDQRRQQEAAVKQTVDAFESNIRQHIVDLGIDPEKFPENVAVILGLDILVIDVDPRNFNQGDKPHKRLFEDIKVSLTALDTYVVQTGTGGLHIYLRIPPGTAIKKKNSDYKGVDFLGKGCYVVGAGSIHPDTSKPYTILKGSPDSIKDAPEVLLNIVRKTMDGSAHVPSR